MNLIRWMLGVSLLLATGAVLADITPGVWRGTYLCGQGETPVTLTIQRAQPTGARTQLEAFFEFGGGPRPRGSYRLAGEFDEKSRRMTLTPTQWVLRPGVYVAVGFNGVVSPDSMSFDGSMEFRNCGFIKLKRDTEESPPLAANPQSSLAATANHASSGVEQPRLSDEERRRVSAEYSTDPDGFMSSRMSQLMREDPEFAERLKKLALAQATLQRKQMEAQLRNSQVAEEPVTQSAAAGDGGQRDAEAAGLARTLFGTVAIRAQDASNAELDRLLEKSLRESVAQLTYGKAWITASPGERQELLRYLRQLWSRTLVGLYSSETEDGAKARVNAPQIQTPRPGDKTPDAIRLSAVCRVLELQTHCKSATVRMAFQRGKGEPTDMVVEMMPLRDGSPTYQLTDVRSNGVSLTETWRSQFKTASTAQALALMKQRLSAKAATPTSSGATVEASAASVQSLDFNELPARAISGDAKAQTQLGVALYTGEGAAKDARKAADWFRKAAEQGEAEAQWRLGRMLEDGEGVPKDEAQAARWMRKAADQGLVLAQVRMGVLLAEGRGVPRDVTQAFVWFLKAAEQGHSGAQHIVAVMYQDGVGVEKSNPEAIVWYRKAAAQGNAKSEQNLRRLLAQQ